MKIRIWHSNTDPNGKDECAVCAGRTEQELQKDIDLTLSRLNWDKRFCSTEEID